MALTAAGGASVEPFTLIVVQLFNATELMGQFETETDLYVRVIFTRCTRADSLISSVDLQYSLA